jgi:hypothetical protein
MAVAGTIVATGDRLPLEDLLVALEPVAIEWGELEAIAPDAMSMLGLAQRPARPGVRLDRDRWRLITAIGSGATAAQALAALGGTQLAGMRTLADAIRAGLVTVDGRAGRVWSGADTERVVPEDMADALPTIRSYEAMSLV